jgi:hypothetical protein
VVTGDLNLDGKPDLAVANGDANTVSVLLGKGDGSFGAKVDYAAAVGPVSVATGDFDLDGRLDLAVAGYAGKGVSVLLGNGDGTFADPVLYTTAEGPRSVAVGDFNLDGRLDLAVATAILKVTGSITVSVLLGNGDGTFATNVDYPIGVLTFGEPAGTSEAVGDFNLDGKPDLAVTNQASSTVAVLLGNGDGTFASKADYATGMYPSRVAVGDFNLDSKPDLAVANGDPNTASVLLGNGNGTFASKVDYAICKPGMQASSVAVGDFNQDSKPDLVAATAPVVEPSTVNVLLGNGDGSFGVKVEYSMHSTPSALAQLAVGDFDLDGKPDIAVADSLEDTVIVLLGKCMF